MALITMRQAITDALREELIRDERVFIMGQEVGVWGGTYAVTRGFYDEFGPRRIKDTPISEMAIGGVAVGAAMNGLRPVAEFMTINFAFLALDAMVNHAAKVHYMFGGNIKAPVVYRAPGGGGRQLGATHSHTPDVIFAHFPGLKVVSPSTPYDAKGLLKTAIRTDDPVLFIEHHTLYQVRGEVPEGDFTVPIGVSEIKRTGTDVTLVAYAQGMLVAMEAANALAQEGIEAEVVDLRSLRPLDMAPVLESFQKTFKAVIVEEGYGSYGIGSEIAARLQEQAFDYMDAPIKRVAQLEVPLPYSRELEQSALINKDRVIAAVKEIL
jgi:pyruvate dehydrogenase E1 component beta subunit